MKHIAIIIMSLLMGLNVHAADLFVSFAKGERTAIEITNTNYTIVYDPADWTGVRIAVSNLRHDIKAVTGRECAPIIVATVGKSALAKRYKAQCRTLKGKWEQFLIFTEGGKMVILGSDKRGTIYGIYELSRQIGVSPWYWMADAPIMKQQQVFIDKGTFTDGEPKVRYRGIFINDEWPSFGTWCGKHFGERNDARQSYRLHAMVYSGEECKPYDSRFQGGQQYCSCSFS